MWLFFRPPPAWCIWFCKGCCPRRSRRSAVPLLPVYQGGIPRRRLRQETVRRQSDRSRLLHPAPSLLSHGLSSPRRRVRSSLQHLGLSRQRHHQGLSSRQCRRIPVPIPGNGFAPETTATTAAPTARCAVLPDPEPQLLLLPRRSIVRFSSSTPSSRHSARYSSMPSSPLNARCSSMPSSRCSSARQSGSTPSSLNRPMRRISLMISHPARCLNR